MKSQVPTIVPSRARPPITPPTIAPTGVDDGESVGFDAGPFVAVDCGVSVAIEAVVD